MVRGGHRESEGKTYIFHICILLIQVTGAIEDHLVSFVLLAQSMPHPDDTPRQLSKTGTSLYAVLGIKRGAQPEEIKKAYRFRPLPFIQPCCFLPHPFAIIGTSFFNSKKLLSGDQRKPSLPQCDTGRNIALASILCTISQVPLASSKT